MIVALLRQDYCVITLFTSETRQKLAENLE